MNDPTDAQLVAATLAGQREAFAAIYDRYGDALYDVAMSMLRDAHEAADAVQDVFVIAAERLHQLREPDRLRAWLFAVLRNDVYRRSDRRRRTRPTAAIAELSVPTVADDASTRLEYDDLARLVRDAAQGLDDRDRLVLELSVRQGLQGRELADALGVSTDQSYSLVFRMRERAEKALGALVVARTGRTACRDLDQLLRDWDGRFSVLVRKRVARHVEQCDTCEPARRKVGALVAFGAAPAWAAPFALRDRVLAGFGGAGAEAATRPTDTVDAGELSWAADGFPVRGRAARRGAVALVTVVAVLGLGGVLAAVVAARDDPPRTLVAAAVETRATTTTALAATGAGTTAAGPTTSAGGPPTSTVPTPSTTIGVASPGAPTTLPTTTATTVVSSTSSTSSTSTTAAPPRLAVTPARVAIGASTTSASVTVRNDGATALAWTTEQVSPALRAQPPSGTLAPGARATITVAVDRAGRPEGPFTASMVVGGNGGSSTVTFDGTTEHPPVVTLSTSPSPLPTMYTPNAGCVPVTATVSAVVSDESALASVTLYRRAPLAVSAASTPMTFRVDRWVATLGPFTTGGAAEWWVRAEDARGNVTTTPSRTVDVGATCIR